MKSLWFLVFFAVFCVGVGVSPAAAADWVAPVGDPRKPTVIAHFDPPAKRWLSGHRGVDLSASPGQLVVAASSGEVTYSGMLAGRPVLTISHGGLRTTYEPVVSELPVGTAVATGQAVGTVGTGGHCSHSCVHWGLLRGEEYLNPLSLLGLLPPILKPLAAGDHAADRVAARANSAGSQREMDSGLSRMARQETATDDEVSGTGLATAGAIALGVATATGAAALTRRNRKPT